MRFDSNNISLFVLTASLQLLQPWEVVTSFSPSHQPMMQSSSMSTPTTMVRGVQRRSSFLHMVNGDDTGDDDETASSNEQAGEESAAMKWAREQKEQLEQDQQQAQQSEETSSSSSSSSPTKTASKPKKRFAVVGGGWGGWGAAKALCESELGTNSDDFDIEVTLLDALPDPTGITPYLSKSGKPGTYFTFASSSKN